MYINRNRYGKTHYQENYMFATIKSKNEDILRY